MSKRKCILAGPFVGELGWEILRFVPYIIYHKRKNPDYKLIVLTRPDRFDLYGSNAYILEPLLIDNKYIQDCFRATQFAQIEYQLLIQNFYNKYKDKYQIVNHIYPDISLKQYLNKNQYQEHKKIYEFNVRDDNKEQIHKYFKKYNIESKSIIIIAPRYRYKMRRNWPNWEIFYQDIVREGLIDEYVFFVAGKKGEYIKSCYKGFYDINDIPIINNKTSLIGYTIALLQEQNIKLCIGSQSAIPNLANMVGCPNLQFGHQKNLHQNVYNVLGTACYFIETLDYNISSRHIFDRMVKILKITER